jgi:hypothetical protein
MAYCRSAIIDRKFNVTCDGSGPPPDLATPLHVVAFPLTPDLSALFPHVLLDALPHVGLAAPLAAAGYRLSWLHTGLLSHPHIRLTPPAWLDVTRALCLEARCGSSWLGGTWRIGTPIPHVVLPLAVPSSTRSSSAFVLNGFAPTSPAERQPEVQRDWLPLDAYALPFGARAARAGTVRRGARRMVRPRGHGVVGLITRSGAERSDALPYARTLVNEGAVLAALAPLLAQRNLSLRALREDEHTPAAFAPLVGVLGVHGSALGNLHACARGTLVVEVTGALMPRMWANFAVALGHEYFAYVAEQFPRSLWSFHAKSAHSRIRLNASRFAEFVATAFDVVRGDGDG